MIIQKIAKVMETTYGPHTQHWTPQPYTRFQSRYLWTDAFGVCNYLNLYYETQDQSYLNMATALIQNVHDTLGKDRSLKNRLNNSTDDHPLLGGLRIGKKKEEKDNDGDGQYYHYITKWAFALNRTSIATQNPIYNNWAIELIKAVHPFFVYDRDTNNPKMYWKISIDRSRPLVPSMGNLDPYDGYITYRLIQQYASEAVLKEEINDLEKIVYDKYGRYSSNDPLDLGEALWITHWFPHEDWAKYIAKKSLMFLEMLWRSGYFDENVEDRLAFREFGTTLGLQCCLFTDKDVWRPRVESLHVTWEKHLYERDRDITPAMYCSSLFPGVWKSGYRD
jgi:hypothetical protein